MKPSDSTPSSQPPRFVDHPARRRAWRTGQRNLAWGSAFFCAALCVLGIAIFSGGARAAVPLVFCVIVFTTLWVLARMKVFSQRNGVFFALAVVALLGSGAGLVEQAWVHLAARSGSDSLPNVVIDSPADIRAITPSGSSGPELPYIVEALKLPTPSPRLPRVRASKDFTTQIGSKTYRIRKGDIFLLDDEKPGKFSISAGEFLAVVPSDAMEVLAPEALKSETARNAAAAPDEPILTVAEKAANAQITKRAQDQAARLYPALARAGSPENTIYVETYNELKASRSSMLKDPEWPLHLAESLAHRLGWEESSPVGEEPPANNTGIVEPAIAPGTKMLAPEKQPVPPVASPEDNPILPPVTPADRSTPPPVTPSSDGPPPPPPTPK